VTLPSALAAACSIHPAHSRGDASIRRCVRQCPGRPISRSRGIPDPPLAGAFVNTLPDRSRRRRVPNSLWEKGSGTEPHLDFKLVLMARLGARPLFPQAANADSVPRSRPLPYLVLVRAGGDLLSPTPSEVGSRRSEVRGRQGAMSLVSECLSDHRPPTTDHCNRLKERSEVGSQRSARRDVARFKVSFRPPTSDLRLPTSDHRPPTLRCSFLRFEGNPIRLPEKLRPEPGFLEQHRNRVFRG
jgi:hypothetical protein